MRGNGVDKIHRHLSADVLVADHEMTILLDGHGNCIEIEEGVVAVGSGGLYAQCKFERFKHLAAAKALLDIPDLTAEDIAFRSMTIAADLCLHTNHHFSTEVLERALDVPQIEDGSTSKLVTKI